MTDSNSVSGDPTESQKIPFQYQTFIDFVGLLGRLFYDDACIVLLDFLAREQKSFLESDLREKLGWRDALIQQKLYLLEKHMVVIQDTAPNKGPRTPSYWRVNHQLYGAVQWRYQSVLDRLSKLVDDASKQHEFECSKRGCDAKYTALEAASCNRALDDEHPLCMKCGSQLKPSEFEETKQQAKEKRAKALLQLQPLGQGLVRIANMEVPVFPTFAKKDELKEQQAAAEAAADGSAPPATTSASSSALSSTQQQTPSSVPTPPSSVSGVSATTKPPETEKKPARDFQMKVGTPTTSQPSSRIIPWFKTGSATAAASRGTEMFGQQNKTASVSAAATNKISFGLKTANKFNAINNLIRPPPSASATPITAFAATTPTVSQTTSSEHLHPPLSTNGPPLLPVTTIQSTSMMDGAVEEGDEIEIDVQQLGRKFKISEITEEIEQSMSDEEYRIYYNASELRL